MRGFPPLHLLILVLAFGLAAVPLARLTFARPQVSAKPVTEAADNMQGTPSLLRLRFAHVPQKVTVKLGDQILLDEKTAPPAATMESKATLVIPKEGIEVLVTATWPAGTPDTAATLEMEPDGKDACSQTHWSLGPSLSEIYSFNW